MVWDQKCEVKVKYFAWGTIFIQKFYGRCFLRRNNGQIDCKSTKRNNWIFHSWSVSSTLPPSHVFFSFIEFMHKVELNLFGNAKEVKLKEIPHQAIIGCDFGIPRNVLYYYKLCFDGQLKGNNYINHRCLKENNLGENSCRFIEIDWWWVLNMR